MNYLVDTHVLCELAKPLPDGEVMAWFAKHEPQLYISSISIGEIRKGLEMLPKGKRKTALQAW
jgi:toxin FitB